MYSAHDKSKLFMDMTVKFCHIEYSGAVSGAGIQEAPKRKEKSGEAWARDTTNDLDAVGTPDVNAQWAQVLSVGSFFYSDS